MFRSLFERSPDVFNSLLKGPPFVSELSNLIQKDPNLAGKSFREFIDISGLNWSKEGGGNQTRKTNFGGAPLAL